ncbi:bifunctional methylenetetrahydrofolate dehydrogenase/methenyltetrahydrofolate cyclohydrolase FolD [Paraliomyxa miuraensis]|uniref:bifunctional methylenetetrahydrofolate dehydrogenase/methenyltetrahydrofolate cyclohydrolase FolD n=1 Tax=Paraliomyxa miuraensis TaxID=376150 RepID=UPI00224F5C0B|nr:bifunctional methylenetetrahydrofolate dehydrogenase/methenyltetrahydrofolate cyclohydrolase FolD [Paraliomyxa miuraensis]MCX4242364.1 bifunctional methylenetetrahydrofolate dehydrogenase/methenyltetrahydrofolate cyclohydrolase FolD [Paraliomyxa miuraensis]
MSARLIDGKAASKRVLAEVRERVGACTAKGVTPTLAVVLVGDDPASQVYVRNKGRRAADVGIATRDHRLPAEGTTTASLLQLVAELSADREVDGILVQLPLPPHIDADAVLLAIDPAKDVDGFHPDNLGRLMLGQPRFVPCTPAGCMRLIEEAGVDPSGKGALVVGRSTIVGKPMAQLLLAANATVTVAHSRTVDLAQEVGRAEILVAAVGRPRMIRGEWIRPGATVIDVGINRLDDGSLVGDVDFEGALSSAGAITPVPGGVGPMTIAGLMRNVVASAERRARG